MEVEKTEEVNKYAENLLFLTGNADNFAIRCHKDDNGKYFYSVREFINNVHVNIMSPEDAEILYVRILISLPADRPYLLPKEVQFLGPYEKPIPCIPMAGLSIVYHYLDKKNKIIAKQKAEFNVTLADCIAGNESKHVRLFDDGQVRKQEQEYAQAMMNGECLDGRPPKGSIAVFDPTMYYSEENIKSMNPIPLKQAMEAKMAELKSMKDAHEDVVEKLKKELREMIKLLKEKEKQVEEKSQELREVKVDDRRKKQKGEAFTLRTVVGNLNIDITNTQFNVLSQRIAKIMREQYTDRATFSKQRITYYYPDEKNLLELLVAKEMVKVLAEERP